MSAFQVYRSMQQDRRQGMAGVRYPTALLPMGAWKLG